MINDVCRDLEVTSGTDYRIWSGRPLHAYWHGPGLAARGPGAAHDRRVTIRPGVLVCCAEDGVVVIPVERLAEVAEIAERIEQVEAAIVEAVLSGSSLAEARAAQGYHSLQSPTASKGGAA